MLALRPHGSKVNVENRRIASAADDDEIARSGRFKDRKRNPADCRLQLDLLPLSQSYRSSRSITIVPLLRRTPRAP